MAKISLEAVAGWTVLAAGSGAAGLEIALGGGPEAVLLDAMMPELDGPATLAELRAREQAAGRDPRAGDHADRQDPGIRRRAASQQIGAQGLIAEAVRPDDAWGARSAAILGWEGE